jgi:hypothetical protein
MKNSSINHFNHLELSFGGAQLSTEGGFGKINSKDFFRQFQTRVSTLKF